MRDGIRCPQCECALSSIVETKRETIQWRGKIKRVVKRRRKCGNAACQMRYTTVETYEEDLADESLPPLP